MIMELERKEDKKEVLEKGEIGRFCRVGVDEDLTMKERKRRWRMVEMQEERERRIGEWR